MEDFTPPEKLTVKDEDEERMNYIHANNRFIGLLFWYKDYQYIYKYPYDFAGKEGEDITLFEKKFAGNRMSPLRGLVQVPGWPGVTDDQFCVVEIIEFDEGYTFCTLLQTDNMEVEYLVPTDLQRIAIKLYNMVEAFRIQNDICD